MEKYPYEGANYLDLVELEIQQWIVMEWIADVATAAAAFAVEFDVAFVVAAAVVVETVVAAAAAVVAAD